MATYRRLDEMQTMVGDEAKPAEQQVQQPPPYLGYAQPVSVVGMQQAGNSNVVVATQPTSMPPVSYVEPRLKSKPAVMIVTIVLTAVCLVQQCWPALVCLVPGLIAAVVGFALSDSGSAEQRHTAKAFHAIAVCCNVATVIYYILVVVAIIISLGTIFGLQSSYYNDYSYYGGCYRTCDYQYDYEGSGYEYSECPEICVN